MVRGFYRRCGEVSLTIYANQDEESRHGWYTIATSKRYINTSFDDRDDIYGEAARSALEALRACTEDRDDVERIIAELERSL